MGAGTPQPHSTPPVRVKSEPLLGDGVAVKCECGTQITGQKRKFPFGSSPFSQAEERIISKQLHYGLSKRETSSRPGPGGCKVTYLEGWRATDIANRIFGFNGWKCEVARLEVRLLEQTAPGRHTACVSATVRVTLRDGTMHEDCGGGIAENMRSRADAIIKAEKEAVTDARKRALKQFGLRLGLSLYDRDHVRRMKNGTENSAPPSEALHPSQLISQTSPPPASPMPNSSTWGAHKVNQVHQRKTVSSDAASPDAPNQTTPQSFGLLSKKVDYRSKNTEREPQQPHSIIPKRSPNSYRIPNAANRNTLLKTNPPQGLLQGMASQKTNDPSSRDSTKLLSSDHPIRQKTPARTVQMSLAARLQPVNSLVATKTDVVPIRQNEIDELNTIALGEMT